MNGHDSMGLGNFQDGGEQRYGEDLIRNVDVLLFTVHVHALLYERKCLCGYNRFSILFACLLKDTVARQALQLTKPFNPTLFFPQYHLP
jgi:hypothetical protein